MDTTNLELPEIEQAEIDLLDFSFSSIDDNLNEFED